jgi:hypothetical protein
LNPVLASQRWTTVSPPKRVTDYSSRVTRQAGFDRELEIYVHLAMSGSFCRWLAVTFQRHQKRTALSFVSPPYPSLWSPLFGVAFHLTDGELNRSRIDLPQTPNMMRVVANSLCYGMQSWAEV